MADEPKIAEEAGPRALAPTVPAREPTSAAIRVRDADFPVVMRGYDRDAVDAFIAEVADLIDALESRQTRETVVQRALEEVGHQTSAILKQAHESGDDITARSRSQAEDRLERARREAAAVVREAEEQAMRLEQETHALREERGALLEDLRRLAAETLAVVEDAAERLDSTPPALAEEPGAPEETLESPFDGSAEIEDTEEWADAEAEDETEDLAPASQEPADDPPRAVG